MQRAEKKVDRSSVFPLGVLRVVCQYLSQYSSLKALGGATFFSFEKVAAKKGSNAALSRVPKKCWREKKRKKWIAVLHLFQFLFAPRAFVWIPQRSNESFSRTAPVTSRRPSGDDGRRQWLDVWPLFIMQCGISEKSATFAAQSPQNRDLALGFAKSFKKMFCWSLHSEICIKDANSAESSSTATFAQNDDFYLNWWNWKLKDFGPCAQDVMDWSSSLDWWRIC